MLLNPGITAGLISNYSGIAAD